MPSTPNTTVIRNQTLDEERSLYGLSHALIEHVRFAGPADGESALKECRDLQVRDTTFELRYPLWHVDGVTLEDSLLTDTCRAALWYTSDVHIKRSRLLGIKALRECANVSIEDSEVTSEEFGWKSRHISVHNSSISGEYAFFDASDLHLENVSFSGKYSFQYVEGLTIEGGIFDTKDAFWHAKDVTVRGAVLKGEYLGWYSDGLTLIDCHIEGTQPLVHCKNLTLVNCEMVNCDLAFEGSDVQATVCGHVDSIREPRSGRIEVGSVGEIVHDTVAGGDAQIVVTDTKERCLCRQPLSTSHDNCPVSPQPSAGRRTANEKRAVRDARCQRFPVQLPQTVGTLSSCLQSVVQSCRCSNAF